jgi:phosphoglycolate phosphatase
MLILFDIDGTILVTGGEGIKAFEDAGRELYGEHFTLAGVDFSGRLDRLIWLDLLKANNIPSSLHHEPTFRQAYGRHLTHRLRGDGVARLLPGVADLVHHLHAYSHVTLGLLTGNYPETGRLKVQRAGLDPDLFPIAAWGCDGLQRRDLPPIAMQRHFERSGRRVYGSSVFIIGDTPHDIDCARAHGCRSIGVATGAYKIEQLRQGGADLVLSDLSHTSRILTWLHDGQPTAVGVDTSAA